MGITLRTLAGAVCAATAAVVWALALAIYQPFMQPHGFFVDPDTGVSQPELASNNTYWPRDIRQLAILLAVTAVVLIARARPRALSVAAGSAVAWLAADLWLDRLNVSGHRSAAWLVTGALVWVAGTAVLAVRWGRADASSEFVAHLVAGTGAVLVVATVLVSAPWDDPVTQPDEVRVADAVTVLKSALAVGFVVAVVGLVAHRLTARRAGLLLGFGAVAAAAAWPAATGYGGFGALGLFGMPIAVTLAVAATRTTSPGRLVGVAVFSVPALTLVVPLYFLGSAVGAAMTAAAGNPPVNGADTDMPLSLTGLALGSALALISYRSTGPVAPHVGRPVEQPA